MLRPRNPEVGEGKGNVELATTEAGRETQARQMAAAVPSRMPRTGNALINVSG